MYFDFIEKQNRWEETFDPSCTKYKILCTHRSLIKRKAANIYECSMHSHRIVQSHTMSYIVDLQSHTISYIVDLQSHTISYIVDFLRLFLFVSLACAFHRARRALFMPVKCEIARASAVYNYNNCRYRG